MPTAKSGTSDALRAARASLSKSINYEEFLEKLTPKERANAERHVADCQSEPDTRHLELWRRLSCALMTLAGHSAKFNRRESLQMYIADGKYRMQVFALEDVRDGKVSVYCGDVLDQATSGGLLTPRKPKSDEEGKKYVVSSSREDLEIERLDGATPNPANFYKDMLGWNRRAIRVTLPITATDSQVRAVETLCAMSVQGKKAATAAAPTAASRPTPVTAGRG